MNDEVRARTKGWLLAALLALVLAVGVAFLLLPLLAPPQPPSPAVTPQASGPVTRASPPTGPRPARQPSQPARAQGSPSADQGSPTSGELDSHQTTRFGVAVSVDGLAAAGLLVRLRSQVGAPLEARTGPGGRASFQLPADTLLCLEFPEIPDAFVSSAYGFEPETEESWFPLGSGEKRVWIGVGDFSDPEEVCQLALEKGSQADVGLKVSVVQGVPIEGVVVHEGGQPAAGAKVFFVGRKPGTYQTTSDAEGRFRLVLPPSVVTDEDELSDIEAVLRDRSGIVGFASNHEWVPGTTYERVRLELGKGLPLEGVVRDESGAPIPARVRVFGGGDSRRAHAGPDGRFRVLIPDAGGRRVRLLRVEASQPGFQGQEEQRTWRAGTLVEIQLSRLATLSGQLVNAEGKALEGGVKFVPADRVSRASPTDTLYDLLGRGLGKLSDAEGRFQIQVPVGEVLLRAWADDHAATWQVVQVAPGSGQVVSIVLVEETILQGTLIESGGRSLDGCELVVVAHGKDPNTLRRRAPLGESRALTSAEVPLALSVRKVKEGRFACWALPKGPFDCYLYGLEDRFDPVLVGEEIRGGAEVELKVSIPKPATLRFSIRGADGRPVSTCHLTEFVKGRELGGRGEEGLIEWQVFSSEADLVIRGEGHRPQSLQVKGLSPGVTRDVPVVLRPGGALLEVQVEGGEDYLVVGVAAKDQGGRFVRLGSDRDARIQAWLNPGPVTLRATCYADLEGTSRQVSQEVRLSEGGSRVTLRVPKPE